MQYRMNFVLVALAAIALLIGTAGVTQADLIAHWAFDEAVGASTAVDETGNHNGTIDTAVYPVVTGQSGKLGNSYLFSGVNKDEDHWLDETGGVAVAAGAGSELETFTNATLCVWFNTDNSSQFLPMIVKDEIGYPDQGQAGRSYALRNCNGNLLRSRFGGPLTGNTKYVAESVGSTYADSNWHQITVTYQGPTYIEGDSGPYALAMYLDGVEVDTSSGNFAGVFPNGKDLLLGAGRHYTGMAYAFDGLLDDLGVWSETLSPGKAMALFNVVDDKDGHIGLAYDLSDMKKLFDVYVTGDSNTIDGLIWEKDTALPGGHVDGDTWTDGSFYYVQLETGSAMGVKAVIPEPSTLLLLTSGLIGLLAYAWRKRK